MLRRLFLLLAAFALVLAACGDDDTPDATPGTDDNGTEEPGGEPGPGSDGATVTIEGLAFDPSSLEVGVGTEVIFTNEDGFAHTVTAGPDGDFDEAVGAGASTVLTFDEVGTFDYFCTIHPTMTGEIVVS